MRRILQRGRVAWRRVVRACGCHVPADIHNDLIQLQRERVGALIPVLYFTIVLIAVVASAASGGGFDPVYHVILPLGFLSIGVYRCIIWHRRKGQPVDIEKAVRQLRSTTILALIVGMAGALWTIDAYYDTHEARRVLAPVFVFMLTFAAAICLNSLPKAAIGAMVTALTAPAAAMILSTDPGIRAMGISLLIVSLLMCGLVVHNFAQMVGGLKLRLELKRLSETDALTGLANRRAFAAKYDELAADMDFHKPIAIMMIDLDGFKAANDRFGHAAGDTILAEVASRLRTLCKSAASIARLGGDEFAIMFATAGNLDHYIEHKEAIRKVLSLPYMCDDEQILISASMGMASCSDREKTISSLLGAADRELYADKQKGKSQLAV